MHAENQEFDLRHFLLEEFGRIQAVKLWHVDVEDDDIRPLLSRKRERSWPFNGSKRACLRCPASGRMHGLIHAMVSAKLGKRQDAYLQKRVPKPVGHFESFGEFSRRRKE